MNIEKDYYGILGISPAAEDIVIRAAYKALVQRYHPDKYQGSKTEAECKTSKLNEAYSVLSNAKQRKEYDEAREGDTATGESVFEEEEDLSGVDPLKDDWKIAVDYYPELEKIEQRLRNASWRLAYSFKATLIELKNFDHAQEIADELTKEFFERYFGSDQEFLVFATMIVDIGRKDIALELNTAIRVLGEKASDQIINQTCKKYPDVAIRL